MLNLPTDLSTSTVKHNADLEVRVNELELELSVWKQAHASVLEAAELAKKAHNAQVSTLNRQISSLETLQVGVLAHPPWPRSDGMRRARTLSFCVLSMEKPTSLIGPFSPVASKVVYRRLKN